MQWAPPHPIYSWAHWKSSLHSHHFSQGYKDFQDSTALRQISSTQWPCCLSCEGSVWQHALLVFGLWTRGCTFSISFADSSSRRPLKQGVPWAFILSPFVCVSITCSLGDDIQFFGQIHPFTRDSKTLSSKSFLSSKFQTHILHHLTCEVTC